MAGLSAQNLNTTLQIIEYVDSAGLSSPVHENVARPSVKTNLDSTSAAASAELKMAELASIILGVIVFAGSLSTAICVVCVRYRRRRQRGGQLRNAAALAYSVNNSPSTMRAMSNASTDSTKQMLPAQMRPGIGQHQMFPQDHDGQQQQQQQQQQQLPHSAKNGQSRSRVYMDVPLPQSVLSANQHMDHEACLRYNQLHRNGSKQQLHNLDTSVTSLHSSGQDSGLDLSREHSETPNRQIARNLRYEKAYQRCGPRRKKCNCGDPQMGCCTDHDADSSDSYEDSLKNVQVCRRTSLPKNQGFQRSFRINPPVTGGRGMRHSFSGAHHRDASFTHLDQRLNHLERNFREPFHLNN